MQTLDIECPSCGEMLELDAGFAGGVCRCSNCGTLMTVPNDASKAETLSRPSSSASVGAGGLSSMGTPDPGPRPRSSSKRGKSKKGKAKKGKRISTTIEAGEYRTASGKVVRFDETTRVPMAEGKRKQIRAVTTIVFFSVVLAVVALAVVGIIAMMGGPGGPGGGPGGAAVFDPAKNPYELEFANVAGLPISGDVVLVVEASEYSGEWMSQAKDIIQDGLTKPGKDVTVSFVASTDAKPRAFARSPIGLKSIDSPKLGKWFDELPAKGEADVTAGIKAALQGTPGTLILVIGYADTSDVEAWEKLVSAKEDLVVHTFVVGSDSAELQGWMSSRDGSEVVVLSASDIEALKEMAGDGTDEEE